MPQFEKKNLDGALWEKQGKSGTFWSGTINVNGVDCPIVMFKNDQGQNANRPVYRIAEGKPYKKAEKQPVLTADDIGF